MELKMMFNKISLITSLLFFLLGTNVFAQFHLEESSPTNGEALSEVFQNTNHTFETTTEQIPISTEIGATKKSAGASLPEHKVESDVPSFKEFVVPGAVGLFMIILFGGYWLFYRRKHI
jgi:hypothetical protein